MLLFVLDTGVGTVWVQSGEVAKIWEACSFLISDRRQASLRAPLIARSHQGTLRRSGSRYPSLAAKRRF